MRASILVVEDDSKTLELVAMYLRREHYHVLMARDGRDALDLARSRRPDLVVLDLMLPEVAGLDVCRILRAESSTPIIMLTAKASEDDKLLGLELGADDYIVKPFSPRELVARVRVVLRRTAQELAEQPEELQTGEIRLDFGRHEIQVRGRPVSLTPKEFRLLGVLARSPGRVFTRAQLLDRVFGVAYEGGERTVDVHLMNLRRKVERRPDRPDYLHTVYGVGYKFEVARDAAP